MQYLRRAKETMSFFQKGAAQVDMAHPLVRPFLEYLTSSNQCRYYLPVCFDHDC